MSFSLTFNSYSFLKLITLENCMYISNFTLCWLVSMYIDLFFYNNAKKIHSFFPTFIKVLPYNLPHRIVLLFYLSAEKKRSCTMSRMKIIIFFFNFNSGFFYCRIKELRNHLSKILLLSSYLFHIILFLLLLFFFKHLNIHKVKRKKKKNYCSVSL